MKKLLLGAITALAFLFGFASCGLTDLETERLYLAGDMNAYTDGGKEQVPQPDIGDRPRNTFDTYKDNEKKQTYKFTYHNDMNGWGGGKGKMSFKVCYDASSWKLDWGWKQDTNVSLVVNDTEWLELEHRDSANSNPGNIVVEDLLDGEEYTIEVEYDAPATSVKIKIYGTKPDFPSLRFVVVDKNDVNKIVKEIPLTRSGTSYIGEFASGSVGEYSGYLTNGYLYWGGNGSFDTNKDKIDYIDFEVEKDESGNIKVCGIKVKVDPANLSSIENIKLGNVDTSFLGEGALVGTVSDWDGNTKMEDLKAEDAEGTYIYDFTAKTASMEFSIQEDAGSWASRWCGGAKEGATPLSFTAPTEVGKATAAQNLVYVEGGNPPHAQLTGLEVNSIYTLTIKIVDETAKSVSASLTLKERKDAPPPSTDASILGKSALVGTVSDWDGNTKMEDLKVEDAEDTYIYDFTAAVASMQFSIQENAGSWASRWCGGAENGDTPLSFTAPTEVGTPTAAQNLVYVPKDGEPPHVQLANLEVNSIYTLTIKIVDAEQKTVSATLTLKERKDAPPPSTDASILGESALVGTVSDWDGNTKMEDLKVEDAEDTYTYDFTATDTSLQFSIQETAKNWDSRWCGGNKGDTPLSFTAPTEVGKSTDVQNLIYVLENNDPPHVQLTGLGINSIYTLTIKIVDAEQKTVSATLTLKEKKDAPPPPTSYSLKGLTLKGSWKKSWDDTFVLTDEDEQEYETVVVPEAVEKGVFGIFPEGKGSVWTGSDIPFGVRTALTYAANGGDNPTMASAWEQGKSYTIKIELTDNSVTAPKLYITVTAKE